jgi:phosphate starvation-inducible protein PhoH
LVKQFNILIAHLVGKRYTKEEKKHVIERGTALTSIGKALNAKTPLAVARKAQQLARSKMHLIMASRPEHIVQ